MAALLTEKECLVMMAVDNERDTLRENRIAPNGQEYELAVQNYSVYVDGSGVEISESEFKDTLYALFGYRF